MSIMDDLIDAAARGDAAKRLAFGTLRDCRLARARDSRANTPPLTMQTLS